jgi:hypothetical protein
VLTDKREIAVVRGGSFQGTSGPQQSRDCPECLVPGAVLEGLCEVCFAELDEVAPSSLSTTGLAS